MTNIDLNPQQRIAVEHGDGPLLVLAGAGSGKTRVLTTRIAKLVERGVYPSKILAVTFTNKAAGEMLSRLEKMLGSDARELTVGTFHSICLRILRRNHEQAGLPPNFLIYDDHDQLLLMKKVLKAHNLDDKRFPPRSILERIMRAKDELIGEDAFFASADNPYLRQVANVYKAYQDELKQSKAVDFSDLIYLVVKMFMDKKEVMEYYQRRWSHILIDEYQDTNKTQYLFAKILSEREKNICAVGDDDQSIYRWRGAKIENILSFERDFPGARVINLEQNYRSTKKILITSNAVISKNLGRKPKKLWTENAGGEHVDIVTTSSEYAEAEYVAKSINRLRDSGKNYEDIVIFYRINAQSRPLEEGFRRFGIPYRIFGGMRFYERKEIKDMLAYLRLALEPNDDVSLLRIINVPARGVGDVTIEKIESFSKNFQKSIFNSIENPESAGIKGVIALKLKSLHKLILDIHTKSVSVSLSELLHEILESSGYLESLLENTSIEAQSRLENINELVNAVSEFNPIPDGSHLRNFLDQVALITNIDGHSNDQGAVSMMTLHLAKGLEFDVVFMIGLEEGTLPHAKSLNEMEELEEERRLCYVGMTRAKNKLVMLSACRRSKFGASHYSVASRFIDEILKSADDSINRISLLREPVYAHCDDSMEFDQRPQEEIVEGFSSGTKVLHPLFGEGRIKSSEMTSAGTKVVVVFRDGTVKKLIAEIANLVRL